MKRKTTTKRPKQKASPIPLPVLVNNISGTVGQIIKALESQTSTADALNKRMAAAEKRLNDATSLEPAVKAHDQSLGAQTKTLDTLDLRMAAVEKAIGHEGKRLDVQSTRIATLERDYSEERNDLMRAALMAASALGWTDPKPIRVPTQPEPEEAMDWLRQLRRAAAGLFGSDTHPGTRGIPDTAEGRLAIAEFARARESLRSAATVVERALNLTNVHDDTEE